MVGEQGGAVTKAGFRHLVIQAGDAFKTDNFMAAFAVVLILGSMFLGFAQEPLSKEIRYPASLEDFPNPERGWYHYRELSGSVDFAVRGQNKSSLIFLKIRADAYRASALPQSLLDNLQKAFDQARKDGVKLIPRVAYNDGPGDGCNPYGCDAPKSIILQHIAQLAPLWKKNKDVLYLLDPGFIGGWGEWHSSSNGLDNIRDRTDILFGILDSLPVDRMAVIRYPAFKREIFGGSQSSEKEILGADRAFGGSRISRVGHLNDCLFSSEDDVGTYQYTNWGRTREIAYVGGESRYAPFGGETCAVHAKGECANTLQEMAALHIDHLNHDYNGEVINRWGTQGCLDTINLKLGHRLALDWARLPDSVKPGGTMSLRFAIRNRGFGELFNPRDVEAVLYRPGGSLEKAVLPVDPRRWSGGSLDTVGLSLSIPLALPEGAWRLGLRLADKEASLRGDPRYSIRLANAGVWNPDSGINDLKVDLQVSAKAAGAVNPAHTAFKVVESTVSIRHDGSGESRRGYRLRAVAGRGLELILPPAGVRASLEIRLLALDGRQVGNWRFSAHGGGLQAPSQAGADIFDLPNAVLDALHQSPRGAYVLTAGDGQSQGRWTLQNGTLPGPVVSGISGGAK